MIAQRPLYVVMGVSGAGKSVVGALLADTLGLPFIEGDAFHPPENRARMAAGVPLTDADRAGWLRALAAELATARRAGVGAVLACSALKRAYRDVLRDGHDDVRFVHLHGSRALLAERLAARRDHFMPVALLDSQLGTLESAGADERIAKYDVQQRPAAIVAMVVARLHAENGSPSAYSS